MTVKVAHRNLLSSHSARAAYCCSIAALLIFFGCHKLQSANAEGDTRTISFHHVHTDEELTITYKVNGRYDEEALKKINYLLRDWRESEPTKMDPHLIDLLWEVHREVGAKEAIWIICGYRSPGTNSMLRRRSSGVAEFSQHTLGKAIDFYIPAYLWNGCARSACGHSAAAWASTRRRDHRSSIWTPAACGTGRACPRRNSPACWRRGS